MHAFDDLRIDVVAAGDNEIVLAADQREKARPSDLPRSPLRTSHRREAPAWLPASASIRETGSGRASLWRRLRRARPVEPSGLVDFRSMPRKRQADGSAGPWSVERQAGDDERFRHAVAIDNGLAQNRLQVRQHLGLNRRRAAREQSNPLPGFGRIPKSPVPGSGNISSEPP